MRTSTPATADPSLIVDIATGFMGAQQLFAANRIGLFAAIGSDGSNVAQLAKATGASERMTRILADGMASLGLLSRKSGNYRLTPTSAAYLTGDRSQLDMAPYLKFLGEISYPHWLQFSRTVDTDQPGDLGMNEERWATFLGGVMNFNKVHADMFGAALDFQPYRRLLDFGGLAPYFAIRAMQANAALETTFAYAPDFAKAVENEVADAGLAARSTVVAMDTATAKPTGAFDLVFLNHVIHRFSAERNRDIFRNARAAATPGARLAVLDFFLDDDDNQRSIDAMHAGEYLVIDGTVVYPESDVRQWLDATGWRFVRTVALPGSPRVLLADAI